VTCDYWFGGKTSSKGINKEDKYYRVDIRNQNKKQMEAMEKERTNQS